MKWFRIVLASALLLALLAACGGGAPAAATPAPQQSAPAGQSNTAPPTEPADAPAPTDAPAKAAATKVPTESTPTEDVAELDLLDDEATLKNLKSYKATWSFEWTGKQDGKDQTVKMATVEEYTSDPLATHTKFESTNSLEPNQGGAMEFYQIGNKSYMVAVQDGKPECTAFTSDEANPSGNLLDRSAFGAISDGTLVGVEMVNGVRTKHYKYNEKSTGINYYSKLTGDVWVAEDGGYIVKDVAEWEGNLFGLLGSGSSEEVGKGSWTREVTEINQPFQITAPDGCDNPAEGLPMMADASEIMSFGGMTTYQSPSKLADVLKFYQNEMVNAGWQAEGDATTSDQFASLTFTRDGKKASVMLTVDGENTSVVIMME